MSFGDSLNLGAGDALQSIKNAAGIVNTARNTISGGSGLPWTATPTGSLFYAPIDIQANRWDQLFPYRLIVVDVTKGNKVVGGTYGLNGVRTTITPAEAPGSAIVSFSPLSTSWVFTLPISPTQLSISDQYAITNSATLRGVLEEHSGARFKMINAQGTMGVWPYRESITKPPGTPGILQSLFGGTIEAVGNVVNQATQTINSAISGHPANKPKTINPEDSTYGETSTGYYQALALQQFLEQYAEAKKLPKNAGWRLVFDIPKQNQSFVVTPMNFQWQQNASKPLEINFALAFKAWRRIKLNEPATPVEPNVYSVSPGILQRVLTTITQARSVLSASLALIGAVRSDVEAPLEALRQTALLVKDLAGVLATAADLPSQIAKDYQSSIKQSLLVLSNGINTSSSNPSVRAAMAAITISSAANEGLSFDAVQGGQLGKISSSGQSIDPSNNVFATPAANFDLFDQVPVSSMQLGPAKQAVVDAALDTSTITVDDLKAYRAVIQELALQLSNNFGAGDVFYNEVYNRPAPTPRIQPMTLDEYDILNNLYDTMQAYDILTATTQIDDRNKQTNMEYVAGLAVQSGIEFNITESKILAPVPFGLTMEGIAARYLGDPQRWLEIATLNNLRDPYIDENGFQYPLLSNATGRQITVTSEENLYVGQRIVLQSSTQVPTARVILGIDRLSDTSFLLTLDGDANLDPFVLSDGAYLQAYLPGTVNSQQKIFIPSDLPSPVNDGIVIPSSVASDPLVGLSKVDWLLTDAGDVATNSFGDIRFSAGITNIIQALKIKIGTVKGTDLLHPTFGLGLKSGMANSDANVNAIYQSISTMIAEDPRFQGLESLQVILNGPTMTINMAVALAGQQGVFPITFELAS
jgi:hypothetical protein